MYKPDCWLHYPAMNEIGSVTFSHRQVYIAVPEGIYIIELLTHRHIRTLTAADGISDKIRFCAFNPSTSELLIVGTQNLYQFIPALGQVNLLHPPFPQIRSLAIARNGVFLETEGGLFRKIGPNDLYQPGTRMVEPVQWFGERDTASIRKWTFLTPYYIMDEQLRIHPLVKAYSEQRTGRLYVTSPGYGVIIYNPRSGFKENEIRFGPPEREITNIIPSSRGLWFLASTATSLLDSAGNWHHLPNQTGELFFNRLEPLPGLKLTEFNQQEHIHTLLPFKNQTYIATNSGLYTLNPQGKPEIIIRVNERINTLAVVRDSLLVGTDNGLFLFVGDTLTPVSDPYARFDFGVYSIAQTSHTTFFGARGRILELDENNNWSQLIPPGFDLSQPVRTMAAADHFLFVADHQALYILNLKTRIWSTIDTSTGLPGLPITALYADGKYLWIATPGIISRYEYHKQLP